MGMETPSDDTVQQPETVAAQGVSEAKPPRQVRRDRAATVKPAPQSDVVAEIQPATKPKKPPRKKPNAKKIINPGSRVGYKYDWPTISRLFIEGILPEGADPTSESREFVTLKDMSDRMKVNYDTLRERAAEERWFDQRNDYMLRISKARQAKRIQELSKESFEFDQNSLRVAKLGMGMVTARMSEIAREVQESQIKRNEALALQQAGYDIDIRDIQTVISARELAGLANAAMSWQIIGQKALGTDITRLEVQHDIQHNIEVDVEVTTIAAELGRDDPDRLAAFLQAAKRAGLLEVVMNQDAQREIEPPSIDDIIDAEIINEGE